MRIRLVCALGCVLLHSAGMATASAGVISATHRLPTPVGGTFAIPLDASNPGVRIAQSFTAEAGGLLEKISFAAVSLDNNPTGLRLALTTLVSGQPGPILATSPLVGLHTNGSFTDITTLNAVADFSAEQIILEASEEYAILFVPQRRAASFQVLGDQTVGTSRDYIGGVILRSTGGDPFQFLPGGDLVFQVTVAAVPEPAASFLFVFAVATAWSVRGRN